jgi:hypothetical protein
LQVFSARRPRNCSRRPGLQLVDPQRRLEAANEPADSPRALASIEEINADDWPQAVVMNPVGSDWLGRVKAAHPAAFKTWLTQRRYDTGGEERSGGPL